MCFFFVIVAAFFSFHTRTQITTSTALIPCPVLSCHCPALCTALWSGVTLRQCNDVLCNSHQYHPPTERVLTIVHIVTCPAKHTNPFHPFLFVRPSPYPAIVVFVNPIPLQLFSGYHRSLLPLQINYNVTTTTKRTMDQKVNASSPSHSSSHRSYHHHPLGPSFSSETGANCFAQLKLHLRQVKYIEINVLDHHPRSSNQQTAQGIFLYRVQQSPTLTVIDFCQATIGKLIRLIILVSTGYSLVPASHCDAAHPR